MIIDVWECQKKMLTLQEIREYNNEQLVMPADFDKSEK